MAQYDSPFTGAQVDDAVGRIVNGTFFPRKNTIALAQAMTKAQMATAGVVIVLGFADAYDGLGGGFFNYEALATDDDNGMTILHPSNFDGAGLLKKFL